MEYRLIEYRNREIEQVDDDFVLIIGIMRGLPPLTASMMGMSKAKCKQMVSL